MRALERWRRHRRSVQKSLISIAWRDEKAAHKIGAEVTRGRPLEVIGVTEELLGGRVRVPVRSLEGPCGDPAVHNIGPPRVDNVRYANQRFVLRLAECASCGLTVGSLWPA